MLKRFTGSTYVERTVMAAIRQGIQLYAITPTWITWSTVEPASGEPRGLPPESQRILRPKASVLMQVVVYVPQDQRGGAASGVRCGCGRIGN